MEVHFPALTGGDLCPRSAAAPTSSSAMGVQKQGGGECFPYMSRVFDPIWARNGLGVGLGC